MDQDFQLPLATYFSTPLLRNLATAKPVRMKRTKIIGNYLKQVNVPCHSILSKQYSSGVDVYKISIPQAEYKISLYHEDINESNLQKCYNNLSKISARHKLRSSLFQK